ncbi:MAG: ATP-binding protein [Xanthomonadales bacterium]|nr:ATP-binding protein [Xanthomonadales bacterium]
MARTPAEAVAGSSLAIAGAVASLLALALRLAGPPEALAAPAVLATLAPLAAGTLAWLAARRWPGSARRAGRCMVALAWAAQLALGTAPAAGALPAAGASGIVAAALLRLLRGRGPMAGGGAGHPGAGAGGGPAPRAGLDPRRDDPRARPGAVGRLGRAPVRRRAPVAAAEATPGGSAEPAAPRPRRPAADAGLHAELERLRRVEGELRAAKQAAEAAILAKDEFLATMSHEIRTPLNGIVPLLDILLSSELKPDQHEYVRTAHESARELLRIVDDILDYSKIEARQLTLESTTLDLRELARSVVRLMEGNAARKGLRLEYRFDEKLRPVMRGDPVRLRQVLTNLLSNAVKFTDRGGVTVTIGKRGETPTHYEVLVEVRDTGIGIAPEVAPKLFRPFTQADASTTRERGGTGLGLAICKRLVELMGGEIGFESEPGRGSRFWFTAPLAKAPGDVAQAPAAAAGARRALAVGQDEALVARWQRTLALHGVELRHCRTVVEGLEQLKRQAAKGERWAFEFLLVDLATLRTTAIGLVRNVLRLPELDRLKLLLLSGGDPVPEELRRIARAVVLPRHAPDSELVAAVQRLEERGDARRGRATGSARARRRPSAPGDAPWPRPAGRGQPGEPAGRGEAPRAAGSGLRARRERPGGAGTDGAGALRPGAHGLPDAGPRRLPGDAALAGAGGAGRPREAADRRDDRERHARRPREVSRRRDGRLPLEADRPRAARRRARHAGSAGANRSLPSPPLRPGPLRRREAGEAATETPRGPPEPLVRRAGPAPPAIDQEVLRDLVEVMGGDFAALVRSYLEDAPRHLLALNEAANRGDLEALVSPCARAQVQQRQPRREAGLGDRPPDRARRAPARAQGPPDPGRRARPRAQARHPGTRGPARSSAPRAARSAAQLPIWDWR